MKKTILAVAAALMLTMTLSSCKSKADQMIDDLEQMVEKVEKVKENPLQLFSLISDFSELQEKYKDVDITQFTPEQQQRITELKDKLTNVLN